jgi:hypothetical protein
MRCDDEGAVFLDCLPTPPSGDRFEQTALSPVRLWRPKYARHVLTADPMPLSA